MMKANKLIALAVVGLMSLPAYCVLGTTHDPMTCAQVIEGLKEAKKHTDQFVSIKNEMNGVRNEIGSVKSVIGSFKGDSTSLKNDLLNWKTYYDKIDSLDADNFSAFSWLGLDRLIPGNYASNTTDFVNGRLNSEKAMEQVKAKIFDDEQHPEEMKYHRQELAHNSMAASVVISNESKQSLGDSKKKIYKATEQAINAHDLLDAINALNKMNGIMASELVQLRELQAQQLEMLAAFFARVEGTGKLPEPSKRKPFRTKWD